MPDNSVFTTATTVTKTPAIYHLPFTSGSTTPLSGSRFYAFGIQRTSGEAASIQLMGTTTNTCVITGCGLPGTPYVVLSDSASSQTDPVIIIPGILGSEKNSDGEWVIDPILHTYDDLIATLDVNHYTPGVDLFTFPYDWRKSNVDTALLLKTKIDEVKGICGCDKVDLIAHSMGGLVARQYIQSDAYEHDVDQLIFLGTPHLGAPKAYLMWEGGTTGFNWQDAPLDFILSQEAREEGYVDVATYVRTAPISSVEELLPVYDYIFDSSSLRNYPSDYPRNEFLEDLNNEVNILIGSGVRIYNFVGVTGSPSTIVGINVVQTDESPPKWEHGEPVDENPFIVGSGDGTVPIPSASFISERIETSDLGHRLLPTFTGGEVFEILTGEAATEVITERYDDVNLRLLLIKVLSPADILVVAPDGKKVGKQNGLSINEIPDAFYTGFNTDAEFVTILNPLNGEYKIVTEGTNNGAYTIEAAYVNKNATIESSFTGNTTLGLVTELNLPVDNQNPESLEVLPEDVESPTITITEPQTNDYPHSEQLSIDVSASDASGVFLLETKLGTTTIPNTGTLDLFFQELGPKTLVASSADNVGNVASSTRAFRVVATASSTISDIDRAYSLGWMTLAVYQTISKKLKVAIKFSRAVETWADGRPRGAKVQVVVDKILMTAMLIELQKYRGKGLNEQAYQLLRGDILWLLNN